MKLRDPRLIRAAAFVGASVIRLWMATVRYRVEDRDGAGHPVGLDKGRYLYAFWHESLLVPTRFRAPLRVLISQHADGELIAQICGRLGFGTVRGSTTRGGGRALLELSEAAAGVAFGDHAGWPPRAETPGAAGDRRAGLANRAARGAVGDRVPPRLAGQKLGSLRPSPAWQPRDLPDRPGDPRSARSRPGGDRDASSAHRAGHARADRGCRADRIGDHTNRAPRRATSAVPGQKPGLAFRKRFPFPKIGA